MPKPLHYPLESNRVIISTDKDESDAGIYSYDIDANKMQLLREYDGEIHFEDHTQFIDYNNNVL